MLDSSHVQIYTSGVPGHANFQDLADPVTTLKDVYASGLPFSLANLGAPISFTCKHVADGTLAKVGLVAEYTEALSAVGQDVSDAEFRVWDGPGGGLADTRIRVNPGDNVTISANGTVGVGSVRLGHERARGLARPRGGRRRSAAEGNGLLPHRSVWERPLV